MKPQTNLLMPAEGAKRNPRAGKHPFGWAWVCATSDEANPESGEGSWLAEPFGPGWQKQQTTTAATVLCHLFGNKWHILSYITL